MFSHHSWFSCQISFSKQNIIISTTITHYIHSDNKMTMLLEPFLNGWNDVIDVEFVRRALLSDLRDEKCQQLHANSCNIKAAIQFLKTVKSMFKIYLMIHLFPLLLFRFKKLRKNFREEIQGFLKGLTYSLLFAGGASTLSKRMACLFAEYIDFGQDKLKYAAFIGGLPLLFQSRSRQTEITLYCVAKAWETGYNMLKRRNYPVNLPCGNLCLNGLALSLITFFFMSQPDAVKSGWRRTVEKLLGDI